MNDHAELRRETIRLNNAEDRPILLCLEPLGEQVEMQPGQAYEIVTVGGAEGPLEVFLESGRSSCVTGTTPIHRFFMTGSGWLELTLA